MKDYYLNASVSLLRNYEDLPFDAARSAETAQRVNERASVALENCGESYLYLPYSAMNDEKKRDLQRRRLLPEHAADALYGETYLRADGKVCVQTAAEDHIAVSAFSADASLEAALRNCRSLEAQFKNTGRMAWNERFGYLTCLPCNAGSGLRAALLLHLPATALLKHAEAAAKTAALEGFTLDAMQTPPLQGNGLYLLENRGARGTEEEILDAMQRFARKLCEDEARLRETALEKHNDLIRDKVQRAYGIARYAHLLSQEETLSLWSALTLGCTLGMRFCAPDALEEMWNLANLPDETAEERAHAVQKAPDAFRAWRMHHLLDGGN